MKNRVLVLTGGYLEKSFLENYLKAQKEPFSFVICADKGLEAAYQSNIDVNGIVGDFDSLEQRELLDVYKRKKPEVQIRKFVPEKDWTDTHLAMDFAMEQNPEEIVILGATGTRMDHVLGNLNLLMIPAQKDIMTYLIDPWNKIYLLKGPKEYTILKEKAYGTYISVIPFTPVAEKVTLKGMKYPLVQADITMGNSLGISNEIVDDEAKIKIEKGYLLVVESSDKKRVES